MSIQPPTKPPSSATSTSSKHAESDSRAIGKGPATVTNLATRQTQHSEAALGDYILRLLRIRKGPRNESYDVDAVCT
jgi:hypothetical protein